MARRSRGDRAARPVVTLEPRPPWLAAGVWLLLVLAPPYDSTAFAFGIACLAPPDELVVCDIAPAFSHRRFEPAFLVYRPVPYLLAALDYSYTYSGALQAGFVRFEHFCRCGKVSVRRSS